MKIRNAESGAQALSFNANRDAGNAAAKNADSTVFAANARINKNEKQETKAMRDFPSFIEIILAQGVLQQCGYYHSPLDGNLGKSARQALKGFQKDNGLAATGVLDEELFRTLLAWQEAKAYVTDG